MNGRQERTDGRLEIVSEMNYSTINEELQAERQRRIKKRIKAVLTMVGSALYVWLLIYGRTKGW